MPFATAHCMQNSALRRVANIPLTVEIATLIAVIFCIQIPTVRYFRYDLNWLTSNTS